MHKLAIPLLIVLFVHSACAGGDARLDKPVTLAVKGEALADIMPIIQKQTGVRLKVARDIRDQKATIFVDDKSLKEIMAGLQTVFRYTWSYSEFKGELSYTLSMPGKVRRERQDWRKKAIDKAWQEFEAEMKRLADMPVKSVEELDRMLDQTESTDGKLPPAAEAGKYGWDRRKRAAARLYCSFSPTLRKALRDGMAICFDLDSPEPEWKIPAQLEDEFRQNLRVFYGPTVLPVGEKWEPRKEYDTLSIEMTVSVLPEKFSADVKERWGECASSTTGCAFKAYQKVLSQLIPAPKNLLPRKEDDPFLDSKVSYGSKELEEEAALRRPVETWRQRNYINRSDLLAILHKKLGLQIISDHYSHWHAWGAAHELSLRSILESFERFPGASRGELDLAARSPQNAEFAAYLADLAERFPAADWGWDGSLLYMRAADIAKMDSREVPNRLLRRWQAASTAGSLGLTEMAEIHTLTEKQLDMLRGNLQRLEIEVGKDDFHVVNPALRLYGLLSPSQRQLMLDGRLSTWAFNAEQRSALFDIVSATVSSALGRRRGCRVGVYDTAGRRVDKPDPRSSAYPESVRLEAKRQVEYFAIGGRPVAETLEETLKTVRAEWQRAALRKVAYTQYEMTLTYAEGTESRKTFPVRTYTRVKPPTAPEKTDG